MKHPKTVQLFLEPDLRRSAENGRHNFINKLTIVLENAQFRVDFCDFGTSAKSDFAIGHMTRPDAPNALLFRRVYHYPFWQIEGDEKRWEWDVAKALFDPDQIEPSEAARFAKFWRKRLFGDLNTRRDGYVYVPLQGRLLTQRSFQKCSPVQMIEATLTHCGNRKVIAGLHPKETYSTAEIDALERLELHNHNLSVARGDMERLLVRCDYVVTQNSGVAFSGHFLEKPALLFGEIDFHHIAVRVDLDDLAGSFDAVQNHTPAFDKYLWWFWQDQSINAGRDDVELKIAARLRRFGWPIE